MPKHIARLTFIIVAGALLAYAAKQFFTVDSFYLFGHYRANSVASIASDKPKFNTPKSCEQCHLAQYGDWSRGVHNSADTGKMVKCEVCHGPAGDRDVKGRFENVATGKDHPKGLKMVVPKETVALCTLCHEQTAGRPVQQKQIVVATHAGNQQCTACHYPHSPRTFKVAAAAPPKGNAAAGRTIAAPCAGCHGEAGVGGSGPALAGQKAGYLVEAIKAYKTGTRADAVMTSMVAGLSDKDIEDVAAFLASSTCKTAANGDRKLAAAGQKVAPRCAACHGTQGISGQPAWPNLAGQSGQYLVSALQAYKSGSRKNAMMDGVAKELSDADGASVAAFFANAACRDPGARP